jgi:hypothetical protein
MIRPLYRSLLWLHPASFEERFAEEMLWIYDLRRPTETGITLLLDCFVSLCRQWLSRPRVWTFGVGLVVHGILALCSAVCYWNTMPRP